VLSKSRLLAATKSPTEELSSESEPSESDDVVAGAEVLTDADAEDARVLVLTKSVTLALIARPVEEVAKEEAEPDEAGALDDVQALLELLQLLLEEGACEVLVELVVGATHVDDVVGACQTDCRRKASESRRTLLHATRAYRGTGCVARGWCLPSGRRGRRSVSRSGRGGRRCDPGRRRSLTGRRGRRRLSSRGRRLGRP
jgi:hypothetical protein